MERFRLIIDASSTPAENMARDEALLESVLDGRSPPVLRFYGWKPPGLSIGYLQRVEEEADLSAARRYGIDCVRRLTGGKSVLHEDELTYSIVIRSDHGSLDGRGVIDSYRSISRALVLSLSFLGIDAGMAERTGERAGRSSTSVCFEVPSVYEIVVAGRKIIGSAQTRHRGVILQHGSVPISWDAEKMLTVMGITEAELPGYVARLDRRATTISKELGGRIEFEEMVPCFVKGFEDAFGIELVPSSYTDTETERASMLANNKYGRDSWNLMR